MARQRQGSKHFLKLLREGDRMTGYVCKYTPVEIIRAFDEEVYRIEPKIKSVEGVMSLTHPNI
jgi:hypothetical protein